MVKENDKIFGPLSELISYKKKDTILPSGRVDNYIYFIHSGVVTMIINHDGTEICFSFSFENDYFSSYTSFLTREPSKFSLIALQDTTLERISYDSLQKAYTLSAEHQKNGRLIAEKLYMEENRRTLSLISEAAEERYLSFLENQPHAFQLLPQKYIASYLGITPVSLSRLRNKLARK